MPRMALSARAQSYIVGNDTLMAFSALVVLIRFYLRIKHSQRRLWWDDYFLGLSLVSRSIGWFPQDHYEY